MVKLILLYAENTMDSTMHIKVFLKHLFILELQIIQKLMLDGLIQRSLKLMIMLKLSLEI